MTTATQLPENLVITYPDGATSADYLAEFAAAVEAGAITEAHVQAAGAMPDPARRTFFTALAGQVAAPAVPAPQPQASTPAPEYRKRWPMGLQEEASKVVEAVIAAHPHITRVGLLINDEVKAFADQANATPDDVLAKAEGRGVKIIDNPPPPATVSASPDDVDPADVIDENPREWGLILADGQRHITPRSCCRWFVATRDVEGCCRVVDVCRTRSEALAKIENCQAAQDVSGELIWEAIEAVPADTLPPIDAEESAALLVERQAEGPTVGEIMAAATPQADNDDDGWGEVAAELGTTAPMTVTREEVGPPIERSFLPPASPEPDRCPQCGLQLVQATTDGEAGSAPRCLQCDPQPEEAFTWNDFVAAIGEADEIEGLDRNGMAIDDLDQLGWLGRRLVGADNELAVLTASFERAKAAILKRKAAYERYFLPQARVLTQQLIAASGGKAKYIDTLGGRFRFVSSAARIEKVDGDAALAWAQTELPDAVKVPEPKPVVPTIDFAAVRNYWKAAGASPLEVPPGFQFVPSHEEFKFEPAKEA